VPLVVLAAVLGTAAVVNLRPVSASPDLAPISATDLVAKARAARLTTLSGTVTLTSNLGLPNADVLSSSLGGSSTTTLATLLAGTHSADVWMDGPDHLRIATAKPLAETNWIRNGNDLWSYDSATLRATHATIVPSSGAETPDPAEAAEPATTPAQFAQSLLDQVTPSTDVRVDPPGVVDGRPVYQLVLEPKTPGSTVRDVVISVDAATGVPLAVQVDAMSGSNPAFKFGFTKISLDKPAASTFVFTPPPGSTVVQASSPSQLIVPRGEHRRYRGDAGPLGPDAAPSTGAAGGETAKVSTVGSDWSSVAILAPGTLPPGVSAVFANATAVTVGAQHGRLVRTPLFSAVLLDDGRVAIGALTPDALVAAIPPG
jgi:outer membrane lipoprotein-sorting protein